jgi:aldose 1-epimerase
MLQITSSLSNAVLYTPTGADFFCFEPVPNINNALNRADCAMPAIEPGSAFEGHIRFTAIRV